MSSVLDVKVDEVYFPSTVPAGSYRVKIAGSFSTYTSESGEWTIINVPVEILKPQDNVDIAELDKHGSVRGTRLTHRFFFPTSKEGKMASRHKKSSWQLKRFLTKLGGEQKGNTLEEWLDGSVDKEFIADITVDPKYNDPTDYENNVGKTYAVSTYPNVK